MVVVQLVHVHRPIPPFLGGFRHGGPRSHHPRKMDDHDLVLRPMVVWGSPNQKPHVPSR